MPAEALTKADIVVDAGAQESCDDIPLHVVSLSGETVACIWDARPHWCYNDIVLKLPKLLPGHRYKLACKEDLLHGKKSLGEVVDMTKTSVPQMVAVVIKRAFAQRDLNLALVKAAGELDADLVVRLLEANACPNFLLEDDTPGKRCFCSAKTALHAALESNLQDHDYQSWIKIIESLIAAKADVNAKRRIREQAICTSVSAFGIVLPKLEKNASLLKLFLEAKANVNAMYERSEHSRHKDGFSTHFPIHVAVRTGNVDFVRILLDAGAHVDAIAVENMETLQEERGCECSFTNSQEETSLHMACKLNDLPMVDLLLERRANVNLTHRTTEPAENMSQDGVHDIPQGMQVIGRSWQNVRSRAPAVPVRTVLVEKTALHIALGQGNADLVSLLVGAGADVSVPQKRDHRSTPSEELCGDEERLFFALQGDVQSCSSGSTTPSYPLGDPIR
mmetsp:Transcript_145527/g.267465  ORF Transcript_145527/g.267465 Transcript_145527/m.267465 type:complete len:449 (-) Transcript_145527:20-1366(-)